jgi:N-acetylmuramoyl-L-alanine amidase
LKRIAQIFGWLRLPLMALGLASIAGLGQTDELTVGQHADFTRLVLRTKKTPQYDVVVEPGIVRVVLFRDGLDLPFQERSVGDGVVQSIRVRNGRYTGNFEVALGREYGRHKTFTLENPARLVIDFYRRDAAAPLGVAPAPAGPPAPPPAIRAESAPDKPRAVPADQSRAQEPQPVAGPPVPETTLVPLAAARSRPGRGVQRVVLDAGHGGIEVGARGPSGALEKDICLAVVRRLQRRLEDELGIEVILTRDRDIEVPLTYRAEVANNRQADLFLSIHANAAHGRGPSGAETYFLSDSGFDQDTRALVALENNTMGLPDAPGSGNDEISMLLWELANKEYLRESRDLGEVIQRNLNAALSLSDRGVKQGRFLVLKGATMPAVLVEVGFISNPAEENKLTSAGYQQKLADVLFDSILEYKHRVDRYDGLQPQASSR